MSNLKPRFTRFIQYTEIEEAEVVEEVEAIEKVDHNTSNSCIRALHMTLINSSSRGGGIDKWPIMAIYTQIFSHLPTFPRCDKQSEGRVRSISSHMYDQSILIFLLWQLLVDGVCVDGPSLGEALALFWLIFCRYCEGVGGRLID